MLSSFEAISPQNYERESEKKMRTMRERKNYSSNY